MNLDSRLRNIEKTIQEKDIMPVEPVEFRNMSDEELNQFIATELNKFHIEENINSFEDAEKVLRKEFDAGLITQEIFNLLIQGEKEFWNVKQ